MNRPQRHLLWLLPLCCGMAGYGVTRSASSGAPITIRPVAPREKAGDGLDRNLPETSGLTDKEIALSRLTEMDSAALRSLLLELKAHPPADWEERITIRNAIAEIGEELSRKDQAANFKWLEENAPELCSTVMGRWSVKDPEAAFRAVVASRQFNSCSGDSLYALLQHQAEAGGPALAAAISEVPWQLLRERGSDESTGVIFPKDEDLGIWLESGVVHTMAEKGVPMNGLFTAWFRQSPQAAVDAWAGWPDQDAAGATRGLGEMLDRCDESEEAAAFLDHALEEADPAFVAKFQAIYERLPGLGPYSIYQGIAKEKLPHLGLVCPSANATPADESDEPP